MRRKRHCGKARFHGFVYFDVVTTSALYSAVRDGKEPTGFIGDLG